MTAIEHFREKNAAIGQNPPVGFLTSEEDGYINTGLIEENWQDILRFVATVKLKVTTASQLFKRLNSYSKQHPLYRAMKEFGKVIKSLFVLQYGDRVELRQSIERQLNKAESSNRFSRVLHQAATTLSNFLLRFLALQEFLAISKAVGREIPRNSISRRVNDSRRRQPFPKPAAVTRLG